VIPGAFLTPELLGFLAEWLPPPPARVLEVGCGEGELTRRLAEDGHRALGIDPRAPEEGPFERTTLEAFRTDEPFDAAVAIRSLHHVHDLDAALASLRRALRPGGRLVLFEFASEHVDADSQNWLVRHGLDTRRGVPPDIIPVAVLMRELPKSLALVSERWGGYLARECGREDLHEIEEAAIAAGELQPIGAWLVYELAD
jgi:SAM-dependent methyltransferase